MGRLVGVGVGPGDPGLITLKALDVLTSAQRVFVPVGDTDERGRAEAVILAHVEECRVSRLRFALSKDAAERERSWDLAAREVVEAVRGDATVAFATLGDPNIYSTFTYLAAGVRSLDPKVEVETVPGITAMQDLAAKSGSVLVEGTERLALIPLTAGFDALRDVLESFETVVCYKGGRDLPKVVEILRATDRAGRSVYGARLGLRDEEIVPVHELGDRTGPYLSTVITTAARQGRGSKL